MKTKIFFLRAICIALFAGMFLASCEKATNPDDSSNDDDGGANVTPKIIDIKANGSHSIYLTNTGDVYTAYLDLQYGPRIIRTKVKGLKNIKKIAAAPINPIYGQHEGMALDKDGKIYTWEIDIVTGVSDSALVFPQMAAFGTNKIIDIAAGGGSFYYALEQGGRVWVWGNNSQYQLGDGSTNYSSVIKLITGMTNDIVAISAGYSQGIALTSTGNVYHWGTISLQNNKVFPVPQLVSAAIPAKSISAGKNYNLAVRNDGIIFAWGHMTDGFVPGITNPVAMSAGAETYFHPMFIKSDGTLWKTSFDMVSSTPAQVEIVSDLAEYRFSLISVSNRAFFITQDGKLLAQVSPQTVPVILENPLQ